MKLKKIASLALAGVMAVSMLAGCATKAPTTDEDKTETTGLSAAVVAALSEDTTKIVEFTSNSNVTKAAEALKAQYGSTGMLSNKFTRNNLNALDSTYTTLELGDVAGANLAGVKKTAEEIADYAKTVTGTETVVSKDVSGFPYGANEETVAKYLAKEIDTKIAAAKAKLIDESGVYEVVANGTKQYSGKLSYEYAGAVSVYADSNPETGVTNYYMVYTVTRTATETKSNLD